MYNLKYNLIILGKSMFFNSKKVLLQRGIILGIITILIGCLFAFVPTNSLLNFIFIVIGLFIICDNIIPCITYWSMSSLNPRVTSLALLSTLSVVFGFMFIFWHNEALTIILGIWLIVFPIIRIILSTDWVGQLKKEIPLFILAILLFFVPATTIIGIMLKVFGYIFIVLGISIIIYWIYWYFKKDKNNSNIDENNNNKDRVVIDADVKDLN